MSRRPAITITAMSASTTSNENRKKLFPSARNSFHGSTIAARFRTIQSKSPASSQPRKQDNEQEDDTNQNANARDENRLRNLADRFVQLMRFFALILRVVEATASSTTATEVCKPGGETDHKPFLQIERLKQNLLHQLECFAERLEDFDFRSVSVHNRVGANRRRLYGNRIGCQAKRRATERLLYNFARGHAAVVSAVPSGQ